MASCARTEWGCNSAWSADLVVQFLVSLFGRNISVFSSFWLDTFWIGILVQAVKTGRPLAIHRTSYRLWVAGNVNPQHSPLCLQNCWRDLVCLIRMWPNLITQLMAILDENVVRDRMRPWQCIRSVCCAVSRERCIDRWTPLSLTFNILMMFDMPWS